MKYNYLAFIQGGAGPDVWDRELQISAADFQDATNQAVAQAGELGGQVVLVEQSEHPALTAADREALRILGVRLETYRKIFDRLPLSHNMNEFLGAMKTWSPFDFEILCGDLKSRGRDMSQFLK